MRNDDLSMTQDAGGPVVNANGDIQELPENAMRVQPGIGGTVMLPEGVELSDISVVGRDLVIELPDGSFMIVEGGAVFVPTLMIGDVEVPPTNLAALLIDDEPQPAAGDTPSSGGNFAVEVPPLDPGVPLGDLIPPTELTYTPPEIEDIGQAVDEEPEILIDTPEEPFPVPDANAIVDEAGLPNRGDEPEGTQEPTDGEFTNGEFVFASPDSPNAENDVSVNGIPITEVGQVIPGQYGNLIITGIQPGSITYDYVLLDNTTNGDVTDVFIVTITDPDGDSAEATLTIGIIDDAPVAVTDEVDLPSNGEAAGNVVSGDGSNAGAGSADTAGADGIAQVGIVVNGSPTFSNDPIVVSGDHGTLTFNPDGSWTYVRDNDAPLQDSDSFTYILVDGDGSESQAQLIINIDDKGPSIDVPTIGEAGTQVDEAGLPEGDGDPREAGEPAGSDEAADGNGADNDVPSETTSGTITYVPGDGATTIRIDGIEVTGVGQTFTNAEGTLTITSLSNGSIGYSFTLADNTSGDNTSTSFVVSVTDVDGDSAQGTLTIDIVDDEADAVNDTDSLGAGEYGPIGGNVMDNDFEGADGASVTAISSNNEPGNGSSPNGGGLEIQGEYGVLVINPDGTYTYTRDAGTPGGVQDVFTYTLTDGDTDSDTATLTITIADAEPELRVPGEDDDGTLVDEAGLNEGDGDPRGAGEPAGTGEASDNVPDNDDSETSSVGTITFGGGDGPLTVEINGETVTGAGQVIDGTYGSIEILSYDAGTGTITYEYTLADNTSGDATSDTFNVVVTDQDNDTANGSFTVEIVDDEPIAANDMNSIGEGLFGPVMGNVIDNDNVGADDATVTAIASNNEPGNTSSANGGGLEIDGEYGTLIINPDGSYTYTRDEGTPGGVQDVFTYTLTDGDTDTTTATLTITIADADVEVEIPQAGGDTTTVYEDALAERGSEPAGTDEAADGDGTDNDDTGEAVSGVIGFTSPDGLGGISIAGTALDLDAGFPQTVSSDATGKLVITGYTYDAMTGAGTISYTYTLLDNTLSDPDSVSFSVVVTDADGDSNAPGNLTIAIIDDAPEATNDSNSLGSGEFGPIGGNVIDNDNVGADDAVVFDVDSNNEPGNDPVNNAGVLTIQGEYGELVINPDGSYTYTRDAGTPGDVQDVFTYTLRDGDLDTTTATLTISIGDAGVTVDIPEPGGDDTTVYEDALAERGSEPAGTDEAADGDGTDNDDTGEVTSGVINFSAVDGLGSITVAGTTLVLTDPFPQTVSSDATGELVITGYTYDANTGAGTISYQYTLLDNTLSDPDSESFSVVVTDADGDSNAPGSLVIAIIDDAPEATNDSDSLGAGEFGPIGGNVIDNDNVGADDATVTAIASNNEPGNMSSANGGGLEIDGEYGTLIINPDGSYTYTRDAGTPGDVQDVFTYTLTDGDTDTTMATLTISIGDAGVTVDIPEPGGDDTTVYEDALAERGSEPAGTDEAADGDGTDNDDPGEVTSGVINFSAVDGLGSITVAGTTLVLTDPFPQTVSSDATGELVITGYTYDANTGAGTISYQYTLLDNTLTDPDSESFSVVVTDADGDSNAPGSLVIAIIDDAPETANDTDSIDEGAVSVTGNVITDAEANGDNGADNVGADDASVTDIDSNNVPANDFVLNGSDLVIDGQYGTLTISPDGTYVYALDNTNSDVNTLQNGQSLVETFTYTITDGDLDAETATLTITINGTNEGPTASNVTLTVSEEGLNDPDATDPHVGNPDDTGTGDGPGLNSATDSDSLNASDPDGDPLTFTLGEPVGNYYDADGNLIMWSGGGTNTIVGMAGGVPVITISVDGTGQVTATLSEPMYHGTPPSTGDAGEGQLSISLQATIDDGSAAPINRTVTINVQDDQPDVTVNDVDPTVDPHTDDGDNTVPLSVDESFLGVDVTANYGAFFTAAFGGDGPQGNDVDSGLVYDFVVAEGATNLVDTATGWTVQLRGDGTGLVQGYVTDGNVEYVVFELTVAADGDVTLDQQRAVSHTPDSGADQVVTLVGSNLIQLRATATDDDNDSVSKMVDITADLGFEDDGPTLVLADPTSDAGVTVQTSDADLSPTDTATSTNSLLPLFGITTQNYGADGQAGSNAFDDSFSLEVVGYDGTNGVLSDITVHDGVPVYLHEVGGFVIASTEALLTNVANANYVFVIGVDTTDGPDEGKLTVTQHQAIDHDGPSTLADGLVNAIYSVTITDGDGDQATDSKSVDLGGNISFADDAPVLDPSGNVPAGLVLDETEVGETDPDGPGASAPLDSVTTNFAGAFTLTNSSNDQPETITYALSLAGNNVASGLFALDPTAADGKGAEIVLNQSGNVITGSVGATSYFTITINPTNGDVTFAQQNNVWHGSTGDDDDVASATLTLDPGTILLNAVATDADGSSDPASIDLSNAYFAIEDDGPIVGTVGNAEDTLAVEMGETQLDASGNFSYTVGADTPTYTDAADSDFSSLTLGVSIGGNTIDPGDISQPTWVSEDANQATFSFSFTYDDGPATAGDATANGTIVFDKTNGTYTVSVDPIQSFSIETTSQGSAFTGYQLNSSTTDNTQPTIAVTTVRAESDIPGNSGDGFYVQFDSSKAPGNDSLDLTGGDNVFNAGELLTQGDSYVTVSNDSNGVAGDTVGKGEVLDMTFYSSNPFGFEEGNGGNPAELAGVSTIFFKLDGIGNNEDAIVILRVLNTDTMTETTIAIQVQNGDMLKQGDALGDFSSVVLDNNDALIVIEPNDYLTQMQIDSGDYVIVGAQIAASNGDLSGTAVDLNGAVGDSGGSNLAGGDISGDIDDTGFKISDIGFISVNSTPQDAILTFDATVRDADGDTEAATQFTVTFSSTATDSLTTMAVSQTSLSADNDVMAELDMVSSQSLMMGSALAIGFGFAAMDVKFGMQGMIEMESQGTQYVSPELDIDPGLAPMVANKVAIDGDMLGGETIDTEVSVDTSNISAKMPTLDSGLDMVEPEVAPEFQADQLAEPQVAVAPEFGGEIVMPGGDALAAMAAELGEAGLDGIAADAVILAEDGSVDALLDALGVPQAAPEVAIMPANDAVPIWDSALAGGFTGDFAANMGAEAMMLQPDAAGPMING
ncbi:beta strand repeat-containing protein [Sphingomicrobium sediminis]|uniref:DUF5801 domain-containing protein n=1 Tax=Sphingomicrobium sediminis TaxID=2950949 RepID=A0A9X2EIY7_9SPHN|nr:DUF5801 repeats-in-toxin domain-containing protein [Sphingomicrobium sediminis]MCM8558382.1 DUF5801 domain-containing protein [Sphingomicrobium sediminis]